MAAFVSNILEAEGYAVQTACNGQEALGCATVSPPDLILLDLRMPVMNGWTCCHLLKQHERTAEIPVIVMSGDPVQAAVRAELEVEHFLRKPFEAGDLLTCVNQCLEWARLRSNVEV
ncbi:MAG: response regulator [Chloroflexota bacterium]|nr:MAG: response regulator [Chloroflexota bacterium]